MSREEWIGVGLVFAGALILVVIAVLVKAWHTDPMDVVRKKEATSRQHGDDLDRAMQRQAERRSTHWLASNQDRLGAGGGDSTGWVGRHDPTVRRFHQAGGYE